MICSTQGVSYSHPVTLERVDAGPQQRLPGPWAAHVKKLNYTAAKQGGDLKTGTLAILNRKPAQRELLVRSNQDFTPGGLEHAIAKTPARVESALGYIVGSPAIPPCLCCVREMGPFPHCVRVTDCDYMTACVNCHWDGDDTRCTEYYQPKPEGAPTADESDLGQQLEETYKQLREDLASIQASSRSASAELRKLSDHEFKLAIAFLTGDNPRVVTESQAVQFQNSLLAEILTDMKERLEDFGTKQDRIQQEVTRIVLGHLAPSAT